MERDGIKNNIMLCGDKLYVCITKIQFLQTIPFCMSLTMMTMQLVAVGLYKSTPQYHVTFDLYCITG